jgi:uncharacterized protein (TIGR01244 family)
MERSFPPATKALACGVPEPVKNEAVLGGIVVGGQPGAADVARFGTIVNCRPDDEPGNVTAELVQGTGIAYTSVPFTAETLTAEHIAAMRATLDAATGPTLVHCQGGTRAAVAVAIVQAERAGGTAADVVAAVEGAGFEIAGRPYEAFIASYF